MKGKIMQYVNLDERIFPHKCERDGCLNIVRFDDEPFCFAHSPDSGSSMVGYSAYESALKEVVEAKFPDIYIVVSVYNDPAEAMTTYEINNIVLNVFLDKEMALDFVNAEPVDENLMNRYLAVHNIGGDPA